MKALWAALALALVCSAATAETETIKEGFSKYDDGPLVSPEWATQTGEWVVRDKRLAFTEPLRGGSCAWLVGPVLSDVTFEMEFEILPIGAGVKAAGMIVRSQSSEDQYYVHIDSKNSQVIFVKQTRESPWNELARVRDIPITTGETHGAKIECEGPKMNFHLDGELITTVEDDTFAAGRIGLRTGQGYVSYDDLDVEGTLAALDEEWEFLDQSKPNDEIDRPRLEKASRFPVTRGQGYFPVLVQLADGRLGAVLRGGAPHVGIEGRLDWVTSDDGGETWSEPVLIVDSGVDDRNPSAGVMPNGTVVVAYSEASTYNDDGEFDTSVGSYDMYYKLSADGGETWSGKKVLPTGDIPHGSPFGRTVILPNGTALMPIYGGKKTGIIRSTDNGETWGDFSLVSDGPHNEMSLCALSDEHIIATLRTVGGAIEVAHSTDGAHTFGGSKAVTRGGQHPPDIIRLESGLMVMVYGNRLVPYGVGAVVSRDKGATWEYDHRVMLAWDSVNTDCGYPSIVQLEDGTLVVVYYAVGVQSDPGTEFSLCLRFTEEDLLECTGLPADEQE